MLEFDFVVIHINSDGDGVSGLYNKLGILVLSGDQYHDKITEKIEGYLLGWTSLAGKVPHVEHRCYNSSKAVEKYCDYGMPLPQKLNNIRFKQDKKV